MDREYFVGISCYAHSLGVCRSKYCASEKSFNHQFSYTTFDWQLSLGILVVLPLVTSLYPFIKYNYTPPIVSIRSIGSESRSIHSRILFLGIQYVLTFYW